MFGKDRAPLKEGELCTTLYDGPRPEDMKKKLDELHDRCQDLLWKSMILTEVEVEGKKYALRCGGPKNCREPESCTEDSCTAEPNNLIGILKKTDQSAKTFPGKPVYSDAPHPKVNNNYFRFIDKNNNDKYEPGDSFICCYPSEVYFQFGCQDCKLKGSSSSSESSSTSSTSSSSRSSSSSTTTSSSSSSVSSTSPSSESSSSSLSSDNPSSPSSEDPSSNASSEDPSSYSSSDAEREDEDSLLSSKLVSVRRLSDSSLYSKMTPASA
jgi:hypothetical protein